MGSINQNGRPGPQLKRIASVAAVPNTESSSTVYLDVCTGHARCAKHFSANNGLLDPRCNVTDDYIK